LKFSIGHRLFASVLLAILAVAASAVYLLRQNVLAGFGEYATAIELDRLEELSAALALRYRAENGWTFIPDTDRSGWIATELGRLQRLRAVPPAAAPEAPEAPAPVASVGPVAPAAPSPAAPLARRPVEVDGRTVGWLAVARTRVRATPWPMPSWNNCAAACG
jgi:two-component system sensor histidine kinase BaeS